ncbi:MAG: chromosome partitioning protein ParA, partial [Pseudarthrobacter sp.]|nr:chromosome partitioning protein ParA [Pseudarthrobacter sp.]
MSITSTEVLAFPNIKAIISDNGTAEVVVAGNSRVVPAGETLQDLRDNALALVVAEARTLQRPVRVRIEDPEGHGELIVYPGGNVESVSYETRPVRRRTAEAASTHAASTPEVIDATAAPTPAAQPEAAEPRVERQHWAPLPVDTASAEEVAPADDEAPQQAVAADAPVTRRSLKETSFLVSAPVLEPATQGWRGTLTRLGFRMDPSAEELSEREDIRTVSQHWPGPRTIAVVNRKGGANKTPTVVMLSAILARYSGAATVAWDNNESQGT